ncbi:MAG: VIT and VWA domain-containing protein [Acidobacteriia bacterium]|nr:VIT and VWA domain-containing protein [Terriglobia bacterium]
MQLGSFAAVLLSGSMALATQGRNTTGRVVVPAPPASARVTQGALQVIDKDGNATALCPLKHTDVKASISGFLARVIVTQQFVNPSTEKIEAVYTFPLPQNAAVDDMTLTVGNRIVRGHIKRREEAQAIYEAARSAGHVAGLLDQERPNIFTQSVANITPGAQVTVEISYVEALKYADGTYEFVFPMVVAPRYIPGTPTGRTGGGWAQDTNKVPDASRITPPVAGNPETAMPTRAGHDISLEVLLEAGVTIEDLKSVLHEVTVDRPGPHSAAVRLKDQSEIPNRDFILRYGVAGGSIKDAVLAHQGDQGGFFTLVLQPPERVNVQDVTPKELIFVLDSSGSMSGFPIEKAKETMRLALKGLYPRDTFNLMTFSGDTRILFPAPVPATPDNLQKAEQFLSMQGGSGGTEMMRAIRAALAPSDEQSHIRIVCFMTDGMVGNDFEIISEVQKHPNARVFAFGIGNSVNRFLLDQMAQQGRGEVEYVTLGDDGSAAARRFHERVRNPLLTDITIEWGGLAVTDVYPKRIPDLFSAKPMVICGRYTRAGKGVILVSGNMSGGHFSREIPVNLPDREPRNSVLAKLWARTRIDDLMAQDYRGIQRANMQSDLREQITQLGLDFGLMTQFTSFVAVEEMTITEGGKPRRIEVPVELPDGVSYRGIFGAPGEGMPATSAANLSMVKGLAMAGGMGGGVGPRQMAPAPVIANAEISRALSAAELKRNQIGTKFHPAIAALIARLGVPGAKPGADEGKFVRDGKASIQIWLAEKNTAVLAELKRLGFEVVLEPKSAMMLIGRLPIGNLEALAKLDAVRYIAPSEIQK